MAVSREFLHKQNINKMEQIFYDGCKTGQVMKLGVEVEHFLVRKDTQDALLYEGINGVKYILGKLLESYPDGQGIFEKGTDGSGKSSLMLFGIATNTFALSLEPAAQLEISIYPNSSIAEIEKIYRGFREHLDVILRECSAECVEAGYHPKNSAAELGLIPKERYQIMDRYFTKTGTGGRKMMRATASTQVSIDYTSCSDFRRKYQAAYILTPVFKYLTDHTPVYEGKKNRMPLRRTQIWENVDKERTGIVPGALSGQFSFRSYAEYLWHLPLIYCPRELQPLSYIRESGILEGNHRLPAEVGRKTPAEIWENAEITEKAVWHIMSMAFPDVRLKNYIEIRGADSLLPEGVWGYTAMIKALLYQPEILESIERQVQLQNITEHHVRLAEQSICQEGSKATVYRQNILVLCRTLLQKAQEILPKEEKHYLDPLFAVCS